MRRSRRARSVQLATVTARPPACRRDLAAYRTLKRVKIPLLRSEWVSRASGAFVAVLPHAILLWRLGWGPVGNDNVGEWFFALAFGGLCPAVVTVVVATPLLRTRLRGAGVGALSGIAALILLWVVGVTSYAVGVVPPGMIDAPRMH